MSLLTGPYFQFNTRFLPNTRARAGTVDATFDAIQTGFAAAQADVAYIFSLLGSSGDSAANAVALANAAQSTANNAVSQAATAQAAANSASTLASNAQTAANNAMGQAAAAQATANSGYAATQSIMQSLAGYALLSGAAFSGSVTSGGNFATGTGSMSAAYIQSSGAIKAFSVVIAANTLLSTPEAFYLAAINSTTPVINWDANDYFAYDRGANQFNLCINGQQILTLQGIGNTAALNTQLRIANDISGGYGGQITMKNPAGNGPSLRVSPVKNFEVVNDAYNAINLSVEDATGNLILRGKYFGGNGGGTGLNRVFAQSINAALPNGLVEGDVVLQF